MKTAIWVILCVLMVGVANAQINLFLNSEGLAYVKSNPHLIKPINPITMPRFFIGGTSLREGYIERYDVPEIKKYIQKVTIAGSLSEFPKELEKLNHVTIVEICCFDFMPIDLFTHLAKYKKLETVSFSFPNSQARYTLKNIGKLRRIKHLSLVGHDLSEVPSEVYKLKDLESISFAKNKFTNWSSSMCILNKLVTIDFSNNSFEAVPQQKEFSCFPQLRHVNISNNRIEDIPNWVKESNRPIIILK